ncbi:type II toxin-antitoxin system HicA family toxin [Xanthomonas translucens]|uniref:type II toxin-antitoxin system HicA family toxin n=1 Tax=Xanthomonas campestris pv. translucens TaxID=343 RepID=UPI00071B8F40|nr:type II toxin-antitoxin system HicA family toxin [Xanthomonas translucens]QSQ31169.1 type II toxin-antitoxin system HicA family toxin [Xanthomonas translucens pv. translucens]
MPPKIRDVLQQLKDAGWQQVGQTGSHRQFERSVYPGRVTVIVSRAMILRMQRLAKIQKIETA